MADDPHAPGADLEAEAAAIEQLRLDLLKAGPTSGIIGPRAAIADALLSRTRDFYRSIAERQRARIAAHQQQGQQGGLF